MRSQNLNAYLLELEDCCKQFEDILNISRSVNIPFEAPQYMSELKGIEKNLKGAIVAVKEGRKDFVPEKVIVSDIENEMLNFCLVLAVQVNIKNMNGNLSLIEQEKVGEMLAKSRVLLAAAPLREHWKSYIGNELNKVDKMICNFPETVKERIEACDKYLEHLNKSKTQSTVIKGKKTNVKADEKIAIVKELREILKNPEGSPAEKIIKFDATLKDSSKKFVNTLKKHRDNHLIRFLKCAGVVGAAILGLPALGVGAFFAGKAAKEKLFDVKGEEFVSQVTKKR